MLPRLLPIVSLLRRHAVEISVTLVLVLLGIGGFTYLEGRAPDGRVVVGNTAGSLTTLVEINGYRIMIGSGPTRSHAADLLGRSTIPWDREIDLLVIPGWDDFHAPGALGLLERRGVHGIAVLGVAGADPIWTLLEREAQSQDIAIRYLDRPHLLELDDDVRLKLKPGDDDISGAWLQLVHDGTVLHFADTSGPDEVSANQFPWADLPHIVLAMRSGAVDHSRPASVLVQPEPFVRHEFREYDAEFVADLPRNERLTIQIDGGSIRIPLDALGH